MERRHKETLQFALMFLAAAVVLGIASYFVYCWRTTDGDVLGFKVEPRAVPFAPEGAMKEGGQ